jgi:FkbM family methyltransferase
MSYWQKRLSTYRQMFGARGWAVAAGAQFRRHAFEAETTPEGAAHPVAIRIKTADVDAFEKVFLEREYDIALRRPPAVIVDAGANVGFASVRFATRFPDARIVAIEPSAGNFAMLRRNVAPYPNVTPYHAALWGAAGEIEMVDPGEGTEGYRANGVAAGAATSLGTVPAVTVDSIMAEMGVTFVDLLKIDIEGAELAVFQNPSAWIDRVGVIVIELHDRFTLGCSRAFYRATERFALEARHGENVVMYADAASAGEGGSRTPDR